MEVREEYPIVNSSEEWRQQIEEKSARKAPSFFQLRAQLPRQGRTNQILAATPNLSVVLKTYASGGENELHAHPNEDHVFVIMHGAATFYGPNGETKQVGKNGCVLIPRGMLYRFQVIEGEPMVMIRIGAAVDPSRDVLARIDVDALPFDGHSEANKEVPLVLDEGKWFE